MKLPRTWRGGQEGASEQAREGCTWRREGGKMRGPYLTGHTPRGDRWSATAHTEQTAVSRVAGEVGRRRPKRKCWLERGRLAVPGRGGVPGRRHLPVISHTRAPSALNGRPHHLWPVPFQGKGRGVSSVRATLKAHSFPQGTALWHSTVDCTSSTALGNSVRDRRGNCSRLL